jgi:hypothetical protein
VRGSTRPNELRDGLFCLWLSSARCYSPLGSVSVLEKSTGRRTGATTTIGKLNERAAVAGPSHTLVHVAGKDVHASAEILKSLSLQTSYRGN